MLQYLHGNHGHALRPVTAQARRVLAEAASTHDAAGASALARDILERWAGETLAAQTRSSVERAVEYLQGHPEGWADEPADFFRAPRARK